MKPQYEDTTDRTIPYPAEKNFHDMQMPCSVSDKSLMYNNLAFPKIVRRLILENANYLAHNDMCETNLYKRAFNAWHGGR